MIRSYIYNVLRFKKWEILCLAIILIALKWPTIITVQPDMNHLTELDKCPACFGVSACDHIHDVAITFDDFYSTFSYFFGVKNVFFGSLNKHKVVLKKLARSFELREFDEMLCRNQNLSHICLSNRRNASHKINTSFRELIEKEISLNFVQDNFSRFRLCPSVRHLGTLLEYVYKNNKNDSPKVVDINIWTSIVLNPEPLVLQILSADRGWPVPKYFGACGRIIIEEYIGLSLTTYYNAPWLLRAKIASTLLDAAYLFTYKSKNFAFYLTDISADNIAVDLHNNAKFVDLENVIVVDKNTPPSGTWDKLQVNTEDSSCSECLEFSPVEICSHRISDHNYYAICKILLAANVGNNIFPGGFLHSIPINILESYPNVQDLIEECSFPRMQVNRIKVGMQLKELLDTIVQKHR